MNHPIVRSSSLNRRVELRLPEAAETKTRSHIFDGRTVTTETAAFQLCDITDPLLEKMIKDEDSIRDRCDVGVLRRTRKYVSYTTFPGARRLVYHSRIRADQDRPPL